MSQESQLLGPVPEGETFVCSSPERLGVSIVVPCCNEEAALVNLRDKWRILRELLASKYDLYLILADDGSTDNTWEVLLRLFATEPKCTFVRETKNLGIAATILNGIRIAKTEIVCSIDCDCSYNPCELEKLLPMLTSGVDLVTGSPYHPLGMVQDVPKWRLLLSKAASALYRRVLHQKLYTYTSCFRVYRRSAILKLDLKRNGFLGIAELIAKLDLHGSRVIECPTVLIARAQGDRK